MNDVFNTLSTIWFPNIFSGQISKLLYGSIARFGFVVEKFNQLLKGPIKYTHYGEIYKRVDLRAEVGLKTRHIHITAEVSEGHTNGGHIKVKYYFFKFYDLNIR